MLYLSIIDKIAHKVDEMLRGLCASLCQLVYGLLSWLYELFMNLTRVELLTTKEIQPIYQRITMILTIVMVFYVTFEAVKYVVQPDSFTDKEKGGGKLTYKMIMVVILIAFVPTIFTWGYKFQNVIFDNQLFSKVILGKTGVETTTFGRVFSANVLGMFYYPDTEFWTEKELLDESNCDGIPCKTVVNANLSGLIENGTLPLMQVGLNEGDEKVDEGAGDVFHYYIHFDGFLALIVGGFVCYMLLMYCVDVGIRVVQLTFLQIIAPIPIIGYLSPKKDGMFQKWVKQCTATYLDLFLRTGIIYFGLLIIQILSDAFTEGTLFNNIPADASNMMRIFIYIALVLAILLFLGKAPKLLGELFPKTSAASGNFGLKAGDRVAPLAARGAGAALGATRAVGGAIARGVGRYARNRANGAKSILTKEGREQWRQRQQNKADARDNKNSIGKENDRIKSLEKVNQAKSKVQAANEAYKNAKTPEEKAKAKAALDRAAQEYRTTYQKANPNNWTQEMRDQRANYAQKRESLRTAEEQLRLAQESGDATRIAAAQQRVNQAKTDFSQATEDYTKELKNNKGAGETWGNIIESKAKEQELAEKKAEAQAELERVSNQEGATPEEINEAQQKLDKIESEIKANNDEMQKHQDQSKTLTNANQQIAASTEKINDLKVDLDRIKEQIQIDNNKKYQSVTGGAIGGAIGGAWTGITHGIKATKLEEIVPKAKEGWEADKKNIKELHKYYDNGGATGLRGVVDRTAAKLENSIGIDSSYDRKILEAKKYDKDIKERDSQMALTKDAAATIGSGEDRLKSKISELKAPAQNGSIKTGLKKRNAEGKLVDEYIDDVVPGETIGQLTRRYDAKAEFAKNEAATAAKMAEELAMEAQRATTEEERIAKQEKANQAKADAERKAIEARDAEYRAEQVRKNAARDVYTQILQSASPEKDSSLDQVAVQEIKKAKTSIALAAQDPELRKKVRNTLISSFGEIKGERLYQAFITGDIKTFDDIDDIKTAVINTENAIGDEKKAYQEQKRVIETSIRAQEMQAAADWAGNSGK